MSTSVIDKAKPKPDLKLVIVGEKEVGKTTLIHRYLNRKFSQVKSTIGAAFLLKQWKGYNIAVWDTAGEERFSGLSAFYFRGAGAAILAYDPSDEKTFHILRNRFIPLLENTEENCLKVVVATKLDLLSPAKRKVSVEEGRNLARMLNPNACEDLPFFETSSLLGLNVDETFDFIFQEVFVKRSNHKKHNFEESLILNDSPDRKKNITVKKCCFF